MKKHIAFCTFIFLCVLISLAQSQHTKAWQDDLGYLVHRIEIMHPDPYTYITKEDFYQLKDKLYGKITNMTDAEIVLSISELLATLKDGHTQWALDKTDPHWLQQNLHMLPLIQYEFKDGVYIMAGLQQYEDLVGMKVTQIGNMPVKKVVSELSALMGHDNSSGKKKYLYYSLGIAEMLKKIGAADSVGEIKMTLQGEQDKIITVTIPTFDVFSMVPYLASSWYPQSGNGLIAMNMASESPVPLWLANPEEKFWFEYLPEEKTMFLQIKSLNFPHADGKERSPFGRLCDSLFNAFDKRGAEKLVIDIRNNTGGNHVELPLLEAIIARPHLNKADHLFLITGRVSFSAAVHLTSILKRYTNITQIGEAPSGRPNHFGASRTFSLPGHPQIKINCSIDYYQDSEPFDFNLMHNPVILAELTSADYKNNIDPALEAVGNYDIIIGQVDEIKKKLQDEYSGGGLPGIKKEYKSNKKNLLESGYNLENFFLEFYYSFLSENKKSTADLIDYLLLSVKECSESIDLTYLLALNLEYNGYLDMAEQKYKRCLELNAAHHYAKLKLELMKLKS